jgi:hypothetical protein
MLLLHNTKFVGQNHTLSNHCNISRHFGAILIKSEYAGGCHVSEFHVTLSRVCIEREVLPHNFENENAMAPPIRE